MEMRRIRRRLGGRISEDVFDEGSAEVADKKMVGLEGRHAKSFRRVRQESLASPGETIVNRLSRHVIINKVSFGPLPPKLSSANYY